jgi:hypothetical protein
MAKGSSDLILRDRMQFTVASGSDNTLVYGRIDLSDYVNVIEKKGLLLKEVRFQIRDPNNSGTVDVDETGVWFPGPAVAAFSSSVVGLGGGAVKLVACTTAYESMTDIGIASPGVYCIEEWGWLAYTTDSSTSPAPDNRLEHLLQSYHNRWGVEDMHPGGAVIVSDLLIGIAVDSGAIYQENDILEVDIQLIAKPSSITQKQLTQMLTQQQDL